VRNILLDPRALRIDTFSAGIGLGKLVHMRISHEPSGKNIEGSATGYRSQLDLRDELLERLELMVYPPD